MPAPAHTPTISDVFIDISVFMPTPLSSPPSALKPIPKRTRAHTTPVAPALTLFPRAVGVVASRPSTNQGYLESKHRTSTSSVAAPAQVTFLRSSPNGSDTEGLRPPHRKRRRGSILGKLSAYLLTATQTDRTEKSCWNGRSSRSKLRQINASKSHTI
jgi:hypothetical protein